MSKFYNEYLKRKQINNNKIYLFKNGSSLFVLRRMLNGFRGIRIKNNNV